MLQNYGKFLKAYKISSKKITWQSLLDESLLEEILLEFEKKTVVLRACGKKDTIKIGNKSELEKKGFKKKSLKGYPWSKIKEKTVLFNWTMINNQGYNDGLQLCFIGQDLKEEIIFQIIVVASCFKIYRVEEIKKM